MIHSMTGFASVRRRFGDTEIVWEIKTVNHRYLEMSPRLPRDWSGIEPLLRERLAKALKRGKVDCNLKLERTADEAGGLAVDNQLLAELAAAMDAVQASVHGLAQANVLDVLRWDGILLDSKEDNEALRSAIFDALNDLIGELVAFRQREGESLKGLMLTRCEELLRATDAVAQHLPKVKSHWRERLVQRIEELDIEVDPVRLEQEVLFAAQKMDVAEETDRLRLHIQEVRNTLDKDESIGRRLDFLMQELNRETNTIASKSVDSAVTQLTVDMKVLIEQMREQVQNIE